MCSPSVLAEIMRPDGSSTVSVISGESLSAELAHELMSIQVTPKRGLFVCVLEEFTGWIGIWRGVRVSLHDHMKNAIMAWDFFSLWLMASK